MTTPKVFGIGLNKTGTTSLGHCLQTLGYRHCRYDINLLRAVKHNQLGPLFEYVETLDSFEDWPYPLVYQQLDQKFPDSQFILTRRSSAKIWLRSLEKHALRVNPIQGRESRRIAYGYDYPQLNRSAHLEIYERHLSEVRDYFASRPHQLLEVCWEEEASWTRLCQFLNQTVPDQPFPHSNSHTAGQKSLNQLINRFHLFRLAWSL